jgi:hypothetical protein
VKMAWLALAALGSACAVQAAELTRGDFAYAMRLRADGAAALYELALPVEVYQRSVSSRLADLRVLNGQGEVLPYAIERLVEAPSATPVAVLPVPMYPLHGDDAQLARGLNLSIRTDGGALDLHSLPAKSGHERLRGYLLDLRAQSRPITGIDMAWDDDSREFSESVSVEASDNLSQWRPIAQATLVNLRFGGQALRQQRVEFSSLAAKYWRVLWPVDREPVTVHSVGVLLAPERTAAHRDERVGVARAVAGRPREYVVDLGAQLPVDRLNLQLPERNSVAQVALFSRARAADPWREVATGTFFRLARGGESDLTNGALAVAENRDRYWKLDVSADGGGIGSRPPGLVAQWIPETLRFLARGAGPYELVFGNAIAGPAETSLDALTAAGNADRGVVVKAVATTAGPIEVAGGSSKLTPPPPPLPWKKWLLWAVLGAGVLLLAALAWRLTRELGSSA